MKYVQSSQHIKLISLIRAIREGHFVIPNFQREFEWEPSHVRELIRSIFLDYYIGSILLWNGKDKNYKALACEKIHGFKGKDNRSKIVLDGQQRLTAMYFAFMAPTEPHPKRTNRYLYFVHVDQFMNNDYDDAFFYYYTQKGEKLLENKTKQFENHIFPLSVMGEEGWALPKWLQGYEKYWEDQVAIESNKDASKYFENAKYFSKYLEELTEEYTVVFTVLDRDIEIDKVCDIFTQINSRGMKLDIFDLMNALLTPKKIELKKLYREAEDQLSFVKSDRINVYLLQVMSILQQGYCSSKQLYNLLPGQERKNRDQSTDILFSNDDEFKQSWMEAVNSMKLVIDKLRHPQDYGAISSKFIPYVSILPPLVALSAWLKKNPQYNSLVANDKIRSWYWISVFLNRYSGSVESTIAKDFSDVKKWIIHNIKPSFFVDAHERIQSIDLTKETRRGTSIYNGVFCLLIKNKAIDWVTGAFPQNDGDVDDHHIVPQSWGKKQGYIEGFSIDTILNRTPLTSNSNRNIINDNLPNNYLPKWIKENGDDNVRSTLMSHFISERAFNLLMKENFEIEDYKEFVEERGMTIKNAIVDVARIRELH